MTLECRDVCNVPNVCWQRVPNRWTSHWKLAFSKLGVDHWNCIWKCIWKCLFSTCCLIAPMKTIILSCSPSSQRFCSGVPATLPTSSLKTSSCRLSTCFRKSPSRSVLFCIYYCCVSLLIANFDLLDLSSLHEIIVVASSVICKNLFRGIQTAPQTTVLVEQNMKVVPVLVAVLQYARPSACK